MRACGVPLASGLEAASEVISAALPAPRAKEMAAQ